MAKTYDEGHRRGYDKGYFCGSVNSAFMRVLDAIDDLDAQIFKECPQLFSKETVDGVLAIRALMWTLRDQALTDVDDGYTSMDRMDDGAVLENTTVYAVIKETVKDGRKVCKNIGMYATRESAEKYMKVLFKDNKATYRIEEMELKRKE